MLYNLIQLQNQTLDNLLPHCCKWLMMLNLSVKKYQIFSQVQVLL